MFGLPAQIISIAQSDQRFSFLEPVSLDSPPYNEAWLQDLIHDHPDLIPAGEIESSFDYIIPVLKEFSLPSGYLDNFYITSSGYPVLVEVKLWKNQEARRKVIVQLLEYAKDFAALSYDDLNKEIHRQKKSPICGNPLYEIVKEKAVEDVLETSFVDKVARNLREGRFLLIILGDGIREEMNNLANYLMHHSLRYAFGVVQIKLFRLPDSSLVAIPSILAKTQTIERHVTVVTTLDTPSNITSLQTPSVPVIEEQTEKTSLSSDEFYEKLSANSPASTAWLKNVVSQLQDIPVELWIGNDHAAIVSPISSGEIILLLINTKGKVEFWGLPNKKRKLPSWSDLCKAHLERVASLIPGAYLKVFDSGHMDLYSGETHKQLNVANFFHKEDELVLLFRQVISEANDFSFKN